MLAEVTVHDMQAYVGLMDSHSPAWKLQNMLPVATVLQPGPQNDPRRADYDLAKAPSPAA